MATLNEQLKEIERFLLEWKEEMNCQFKELRECLRPTPIDLQMDSQGANSADPRVLDALIEADRIYGAALVDGDVVRILASPDLDANSMHQKVEPNLVEANINSGGLVENPSQDDILELPSHGPVVTEPISFSSKISELLSFKMELSPAKPEGTELLQKPIFSCQEEIEDSVTKADGDRQILYVSSMEDLCPSNTADDLSKIDATIDTSIHEIVPGRFIQVEKQSLLNAHHMFDEMPKGKVEVFQHSKVIFVPLVVSEMGCVDSEMVYDDDGDVFAHSIDLIRSRADDSPGLFVFDPGKRIRFMLHSGVIEALVIFVFDPGISCKV